MQTKVEVQSGPMRSYPLQKTFNGVYFGELTSDWRARMLARCKRNTQAFKAEKDKGK